MPIWWEEPFGNSKGFRENGKENALIAAQDRQAGEQKRMSVKATAPDAQAGHRYQITKQTERYENSRLWSSRPFSGIREGLDLQPSL